MKWFPDARHGTTIDATHTMYPTFTQVMVTPGTYSKGSVCSTTYGVLLSGSVEVRGMVLRPGAYFCLPGEFKIELAVSIEPGNRLILIERMGYRGQIIFGQCEPTGRLTYIDGCSDSMLVYPPRKGDPVLNHLHFPGRILQTQHTHPSIRVGVVMKGQGVSWRGEHGQKNDLMPFMRAAEEYGLATAVTDYEKNPDKYHGVEMLYHLRAGGVFLLEQGELHSFATMKGGGMDIVAYHPDSDWGPTDEDHPMLNRTHIRVT